MTEFYIGIFLNDINAKILLFANGKSVAKRSISIADSQGYTTTVLKIEKSVREIFSASDLSLSALRSVVAAVPGVVDVPNGIVRKRDGCDRVNQPFARDLSARLQVPVRLCKAANAAAWGEFRFGAFKSYSDAVLLTLDEQVGSGIISCGRLLENAGGGEVGHMVVESGGIPCSCGRRGCLEQYVSAGALVRDTKKVMFECRSSAMWDLVDGDCERVDDKTAFSAAKADDEAGKKVIRNYIAYLGDGIVNVVNLLRPQAVAIGGKIGQEGEYILAPLRRYIAERIYFADESAPLVITRAKLGGDAEIVGAAALAAGI